MAMAKKIIILLAMLFIAGCAIPATKYEPGMVIPADKVVIIGKVDHTSNFRDVKDGVLTLDRTEINYKVGETFKLIVPRVDAMVEDIIAPGAIIFGKCTGFGLNLAYVTGEMVEVGTLIIQEHRDLSWNWTAPWREHFSWWIGVEVEQVEGLNERGEIDWLSETADDSGWDTDAAHCEGRGGGHLFLRPLMYGHKKVIDVNRNYFQKIQKDSGKSTGPQAVA